MDRRNRDTARQKGQEKQETQVDRIDKRNRDTDRQKKQEKQKHR